MNDEFASNSIDILLGRSFMKMVRTKINVHKGTLSFESDWEIMTFNILYAMKHYEAYEFVFHIDMIDLTTQEIF
jgi:hypothetical protein